MSQINKSGQIVILNGTPRSGKFSIAAVIQYTFEGVWMNLGVDRYKQMIPERDQPGIGLRPRGERPDLEPQNMLMYKAMYKSIAVHSRLGINVVVDVGHHDVYSVPRAILPHCARILKGLPVMFVGVRCPIEVVMKRRIDTWHVGYSEDGSVHVPGIYDLEVDTSVLNAEACANLISQQLKDTPSPTAFQFIEEMGTL